MTGASPERKARDTNTDTPAVQRYALSVREAAASCGMAEGTLRDAVKRGEVAVVTIGQGRVKGRFVILPADLEAFLRRRRRPAAWETDPPEGGRAA